MEEKDFYNVKEVCEALGLSRDRVYEHLRRGVIKGTQLTNNSKWLIHRDEIERIKREGGIKVKSSDTTTGIDFRMKKLVAPYVDMQKHRDTIIKAAIPELDIGVFPPRDFDLAIFWSRPHEPHWPISKGRIKRQNGDFIVQLTAEDKLEWTYLRQHLKNDPIWDAIDAWKQAMVTDFTARFGLLDKIVDEIQSKIGLPVLENLGYSGNDKDGLGLYYAYTLYDQVFSRVVGIPLAQKHKEDFTFESPNFTRLGGYMVVRSHDLSLHTLAINYLLDAQVSLVELTETRAARATYEEALSRTALVKKHSDRIRLEVAFPEGSICDGCSQRVTASE